MNPRFPVRIPGVFLCIHAGGILSLRSAGNAVKLIRIDVNAGHGHGKPMSKVIEEYTDIQSFIMYNLGVKP